MVTGAAVRRCRLRAVTGQSRSVSSAWARRWTPLETFEPQRYRGRILGMVIFVALVESLRRKTLRPSRPKRMMKRFSEGFSSI